MNTRTRHANRRRGFTLIELLIVLAILLAIGGLVVVGYVNIRSQSDVDIQRIQFDQIQQAMRRFHIDMRRYPYEEEGLSALWNSEMLETEEDMNRWRGPYLEEPILRDVWGTELLYQYPSEERGEGHFDLISAGPDREFGTEDDITNHDRLRGADGEIDNFDDFGGGDFAPRGP